MDKITSIIVIVAIIYGCSQVEKDKVKIESEYEVLEKAMARTPGLYLESDSLVTIISILNEKGHIIDDIMYQGSADMFWTDVIKRSEKDKLKDTLVNSFEAKPILPDKSKLVLYFMIFKNVNVEVIRNGNLEFEGKTKTFDTAVVLDKKRMDQLQLTVDGSQFNLEIRNEYNFIELINKDSIIQCNYLYYSPIPVCWFMNTA